MGRLGFVDGNVFHPPSGYSEALLAIQLSLSPPPPPPCLRFRPVPWPQGPGAILLPQVPPHPCDLRSPPRLPSALLVEHVGTISPRFVGKNQRWLFVNFLRWREEETRRRAPLQLCVCAVGAWRGGEQGQASSRPQTMQPILSLWVTLRGIHPPPEGRGELSRSERKPSVDSVPVGVQLANR